MEYSKQMASKVIIITIIAASITCVFTQLPVKLDERHLRVPKTDNDQVTGKGWQDSVPGLPGKDYPNLTIIPMTSFTCEGKTPGGYYADVETRCQVFHVCSTQGSKSSFLCPSGSIFNQRHFVCDWWYDFECSNAPELYSLNAALDEPEPLQFNSLGNPSTDLSLASSGYSSNLRDEGNFYYGAYTSPKTLQIGFNLSTEKADGSVSSDNSSFDSRSSVSTASVISSSDSSHSSPDNYSHARHQESRGNRNGEEHLNELELNQLQRSYHHQGEDNQGINDFKEDGQPKSYRTRPNENRDIVPRGFSKTRADEQIRVTHPDFKRSDHTHGLYVNNGLSIEFDKKQDDVQLRQNNFIENKNPNLVNKNNNNYYYGSDKNYYDNLENNPQNNNYANYNYNYNGAKTNTTSNHQYNEYNIKNDINNNDEQFINQNNNYYEHYYQETENSEFNPNQNNNYDYPEDHYIRGFQVSTATPHSIYLDPAEDEADRERQREVDSVDLKRQRTWRDDLPARTSASESPPQSPEPPKGNFDYNPASLSKPKATTGSLVTVNGEESRHVGERPKFLGRRPAGGLPSGSGNGLPGAKKILAASDSITGKPSTEIDTDQLSPAVTGATSTWNQHKWDETDTSYVPLQPDNGNTGTHNNNRNNNKFNNNNNDYHEFQGYGQYSN